jgi:hypothetical protein
MTQTRARSGAYGRLRKTKTASVCIDPHVTRSPPHTTDVPQHISVLNGFHVTRSWLAKTVMNAPIITATQVHPKARCEIVPFGAKNWIRPSATAARARNACT